MPAHAHRRARLAAQILSSNLIEEGGERDGFFHLWLAPAVSLGAQSPNSDARERMGKEAFSRRYFPPFEAFERAPLAALGGRGFRGRPTAHLPMSSGCAVIPPGSGRPRGAFGGRPKVKPSPPIGWTLAEAPEQLGDYGGDVVRDAVSRAPPPPPPPGCQTAAACAASCSTAKRGSLVQDLAQVPHGGAIDAADERHEGLRNIVAPGGAPRRALPAFCDQRTEQLQAVPKLVDGLDDGVDIGRDLRAPSLRASPSQSISRSSRPVTRLILEHGVPEGPGSPR